MEKIVCIYCGEEYEECDKACPRCGTVNE